MERAFFQPTITKQPRSILPSRKLCVPARGRMATFYRVSNLRACTSLIRAKNLIRETTPRRASNLYANGVVRGGLDNEITFVAIFVF